MRPDPQTQALNVMIEEASAQGKPWHEMEPQELRDTLAKGGPFGPPPPRLDDIAEERTIPGPAGEIPVRVFIPPVVRGVYLHIHGGGWVIGSHDAQDERLWSRAQVTQQAVVSVGYRLSPEHPYPGPNEDCEAAAVWLVENGQSEFGTDVFTIGGESAGGHLSAVTLLRMRDNHGYSGFQGAALTYGVYDLRPSPSAKLWGDRNLILSTPIIEWFIDHYVTPEEPELRSHPDVTPLLADLSDMPPAIFTVGTLDPLLDDSLFMAARWQAAGHETELHVFPEAPHGFDGFPTPAGMDATNRINNFLSGCVG